MVPKTEIDGPGNAMSAGPACVPADLSTNPRHIAAIPTGITRPPHRTKRSPTPTHIARRNGQRQRASPDASGSKHGDCGKNRSERWGCGDFVPWAAHAAAAAPPWGVQHLEIESHCPLLVGPREQQRPDYIDELFYRALAVGIREAPCFGPSTTTTAPISTRL